MLLSNVVSCLIVVIKTKMQRINKAICHLTTVLTSSKRSDILRRLFSSETTTTNSNDTDISAKDLSGFAKSFQEHDELLQTQTVKQTFPEMLRNSRFMDVRTKNYLLFFLFLNFDLILCLRLCCCQFFMSENFFFFFS